MSEHPTSLAEIISGQAEAAHSIFAPSSANMWLLCSGSLIPNVLSNDKAGWEAAEGTVAHELAEQWARTKIRPVARIGEIVECDGYEIEITEEMLAYVEDYLNWCGSIEGFAGVEFDHYEEERVDLSLFLPLKNQGGTADHFACGVAPDGSGVLVITDLKYGKGVPVFAATDTGDPRALVDGRLNGNPQAMMYALGVFVRYDHLYHFETIVIRICQPRLGYFGVWQTTRAELLRFANYVLERAPEALRPDAPRTPGPKQCQFCRVRTTCPALYAYGVEMLADVFTDLDATDGTYSVSQMNDLVEIVSDPLCADPFPEPCNVREIPIHALEKILPMRRIIEGWFEDINNYLTNAAVVDEHDLRVYKVVEGRTNRKHRDEQKSAKVLLEKGLTADDIWTTTLISPAQAEEALHKRLKVSKADAKAMLEPLVYQPPGPKTLALRTDSRPELPAAGDVFAPLDDL